jgi:hypothetical protein
VACAIRFHIDLTRVRDEGGNASAEEASEALEDGAKTVNNVVHSFRLQSTTFDKKGYLSYLKGYMKAVKVHLEKQNPERVAEFEKGAQTFAKKIVGDFKNYEFVRGHFFAVRRPEADRHPQFTGETMNPEGMVALLNYREDGITRESLPASDLCHTLMISFQAYFTFWKDGLKQVKL